MRLSRAGFLLLACVAGFMVVSSGNAEASPGRASRPWRSVVAPPVLLTLSDYVMQLPGDVPEPGEEEERDTTIFEPPAPPAGAQPPGGNQPSPFTPKFSAPDTTVRPDSLFPRAAPAGVETVGPTSTILPIPSGASAPRPPVVKGRRGVLGVHPLAILAGLIAFDIFIISVVGK